MPAARNMATIQVPIREAINMAIDEEMARDERVFIIGTLSLDPVLKKCSDLAINLT
jgi:hypothetical protein